MKSVVIEAIVRHMVGAIGAGFVGRGLMSNEEVSQIGGAIAVIVAVIWSVLEKKGRPPTPPPEGGVPGAAVVAAILVALIPIAALAQNDTSARTVVLEWNRNPEPDVTVYRVMAGTNSRAYTRSIMVSNATRVEIRDLGPTQFFFAVAAVGPLGLESAPSPEIRVDLTGPSSPANIRVISVTRQTTSTSTTTATSTETETITLPPNR